ncbi:MAG: hypothetical protein ACKVOJ_13225 [Sphingomonadaceae bacterium]
MPSRPLPRRSFWPPPQAPVAEFLSDLAVAAILAAIMAIMAINNVIITDIVSNIIGHIGRIIGKIMTTKKIITALGIKITTDMIDGMMIIMIAIVEAMIVIVITTGTMIGTTIGAGKIRADATLTSNRVAIRLYCE